MLRRTHNPLMRRLCAGAAAGMSLCASEGAYKPSAPCSPVAPSTPAVPSTFGGMRRLMSVNSITHSSSPMCGTARPFAFMSKSAEKKKDGEPEKPIPISRVVGAVARLLWPAGQWQIKLCVGVSVSFVLLSKVAKVALPFWFRSIIDALASPETASTAATIVGPWSLSVFAMVMAYGITRMSTVFMDEAKTAIFAPVGGKAATEVNMTMFRKLHNLDLGFHLSRQTGVLSKDLDRGSRAFWSLTYALLFMLVPTAFEMLLVGYALQTQAGVAFVGTAVTAVASYVGWTWAATNYRAQFRDKYNAADSKVGGMTVDSLLNFETVKYFNAEEFENKRLHDATSDMNKHLIKLDQTMALLNFGQQAIFVVAAVTSMYFSTCGVLAGTMTVGDLVLVDALLLQLYTPLQWLGMTYRELQQSTQNMQAMIRLLDQHEAISDSKDAVAYQYKTGEIELKDVCFAYNPQRVVLDKISLKIAGGNTVAFVGPSGSGKSTIFRVLFRFFDPSSGEVLIDGQPLRNLQLDSYRKELGVIPQDTVLFNDTIRYNLRYGRRDASDEEVERVARESHILESISHFPDGMDTVVGERGLKLSGGEKQRVAIGRVLLKDAPIFLADEATSALDTQTESQVMRTVRDSHSSGKKRTTVIIAHRLSTVKDADCIYVLNARGSLEEQGSHDELLARGGLYHSLWLRQQKNPDDEKPAAEKKDDEEDADGKENSQQ